MERPRFKANAQEMLVRPKRGVVERARAAGQEVRDIATVSAGLLAVTLVSFDIKLSRPGAPARELKGSRADRGESRRTEREKALDQHIERTRGKEAKNDAKHAETVARDVARLKVRQAAQAQQRAERIKAQEAETRARAERAKEIAAQKKAAAAEAKKRKAEVAEQQARWRLEKRKRGK